MLQLLDIVSNHQFLKISLQVSALLSPYSTMNKPKSNHTNPSSLTTSFFLITLIASFAIVSLAKMSTKFTHKWLSLVTVAPLSWLLVWCLSMLVLGAFLRPRKCLMSHHLSPARIFYCGIRF
uniref:Uncharacterized protein n=1 Tax=Rhizophora mucronata TaxID=61149 RepID=A0A2P2IGZ1_RHIMU